MIIGITAGRLDGAHRVVDAYTGCIAATGAVPLIIPVTDDIELLRRTMRRIDGLLMIGGGDVHPRYWHEELMPQSNTPDPLRDTYDLAVAAIAYELSIPTLGICRGMQVMNIAFGGDIYQDIYSQQPDAELLEHAQTLPRCETSHTVDVKPGTVLHRIVGVDTLAVNSFHHQAVRRVAPGWVASAVAPDGTVEAVEHTHYPMMGVQWHPEELHGTNAEQRALFDWLVAEAGIYRTARRIHRQVVVTDTHTDTPMVWTADTNLGIRGGKPAGGLLPVAIAPHNDDNRLRVDFQRCADGGVRRLFMVAYLPQTARPADADYRQKAHEAHRTAIETIERLKREVQNNGLLAVLGNDNIAAADGRVQVYFGLENGFALAGNIDNVDLFHRLGVRYITLCHNGDNDLCDSARGSNTHGGLSAFGRKVIKRMNLLGMMVDVSHAADSTIRQVIELSAKPVIATHTSSFALCPHLRNMTDETVEKLASSGGRIHVCLYRHFLRQDGNASIVDICNHIDHLVKLVGPGSVGIGSDFDGGGGVPGCDDESQLILITAELLRRGYDTHAVELIMGRGFETYWSKILRKEQ